MVNQYSILKISKWTYENLNSDPLSPLLDTGQVSPYLQPQSCPSYPMGQDPGISLNLRGGSKLSSVAVSKCVASRYPCVLMCQQVKVNCTSASTVSPRVPFSV
ncbi:unnamed protein product [Pipistrellus nathusii]|uniref:Uncharacterized protein n=1 Tax=Pipistrellus nathusii TaxID=59473 RepID=A0ABN9ZWP1_PIPNA